MNSPGRRSTRPVHPTEIYDALLNLALYFFLAWLFRRKKFDGQIFATYLLCYAVTRSFVEYFRGDYPICITTSASRRRSGQRPDFSSPASRSGILSRPRKQG
jgi:prolipoprotein diacylglyceryltransferase